MRTRQPLSACRAGAVTAGRREQSRSWIASSRICSHATRPTSSFNYAEPRRRGRRGRTRSCCTPARTSARSDRPGPQAQGRRRWRASKTGRVETRAADPSTGCRRFRGSRATRDIPSDAVRVLETFPTICATPRGRRGATLLARREAVPLSHSRYSVADRAPPSWRRDLGRQPQAGPIRVFLAPEQEVGTPRGREPRGHRTLPSTSLSLDERQQIGVDRLRLRGGHSVREALVGLQRPVLQ